jgi:opacity protein-like surface antigen
MRSNLSWIVCLAGFLTAHSQAHAVTSYNISGSGSDNHYGIQTHQSRAGSVGVEYAVTQRLSLGVSHRQEIVHQGGHREINATETQPAGYQSFTSDSRIISNAATVTVSLYNGVTLIPYAFLGLAKSIIHTRETVDGENSDFHADPWGPQAGLGLSVKLSKQFALRLSYTASPGSIIQDPTIDPDDKVDATNSYVQVGLSYRP